MACAKDLEGRGRNYQEAKDMHDQWLDQWIGLCEWRGANYHHTRWRQTRHAFVDEEAELEEEQDG